MPDRKSLARRKHFPIEDFGVGTIVSRQAVGALYRAAVFAGKSSAARSALHSWKTLLSRATGHDLGRPSQAMDELARAYAIETENHKHDMTAAIPFALHTYYAILVKLILTRAFAPDSRIFDTSCSCSDDAMLELMHAVESSRLASALRMPNPTREEGPTQDFSAWDPFDWYLRDWNASMAAWIRQAVDVIARSEPSVFCSNGISHPVELDLLGSLYQTLLPKKVRHALGEYYTPSWLVAYMLDRLEYSGQPNARLLDPSCGSGNFLLAAVRRIRQAHDNRPDISPEKLARTITENVVGFDLNPTAVMAARANYLLSMGGLFSPHDPPQVPIYLRDTILAAETAEKETKKFDYVVGNPPWIAWDNLPDDYRERTKTLWQQYGLFTLSGTAARHGGGKKDLSMLMTYVCADRHLVDGGRLGFVVTQTLFQTKGAGDGFRRFRIGDDGPELEVLHADDMVAIKPFPEAANWTGAVFIKKGAETKYPISYDRWHIKKSPRKIGGQSENDWRERFCQDRLTARPIEHDRGNSPWFVQPAGLKTDLTQMIGPSGYTAHLGANTGGANAVYWLQISKAVGDDVLVANLTSGGARDRRVAAVEQAIEPGLIYPLVRWGDVARFRAVASAHILLAQNVDTRRGHDENFLKQQYPKTLDYLNRFRDLLTKRAAYRRYQSHAPFYSMYNVGSYTTAPIKVVWRRMDKRINAAVLEPFDDPLLGTRPAVPQETCVIVAVDTSDEAHYLASVLNCRQTGLIVAGHSVSGGKGFGTPSMLDYLNIEKFDPNDPRHMELARLGRLAHERAATGNSTSEIQAAIDKLAEQ